MRYEYSHSGIDEGVLAGSLTRLSSYQKQLSDVVVKIDYTQPEASLAVPFDEDHWRRSKEVARKIGPIRQLVIVGIGGSSIGFHALYNALAEPEKHPSLHILDLLDEHAVVSVAESLCKENLADFAVVIVSKSGTTTETLANADVLLSILKKHFGDDIYGRIVAVGNEHTPLAQLSHEQGVSYVAIPDMVGGRFSIFTAVGLVPLALMGIDATPFLTAAQEHIQKGLLESSSSAQAGAVLSAHIEKGTKVHVLFYEHSRLEGCARWYQQLLAESLGKRKKDGSAVGIVPVLMSPRELHSTAQLFLSGFPAVLTSFIGAQIEKKDTNISTTEYGELLSLRGDRSFGRIPEAIMQGVHRAYIQQHLPHVYVTIEAISLATLGTVMAEKMLEVMYAAHLLDINAFDQPHVELYKKETHALLEQETM